MSDDDVDTARTTVKTYLPAYQKARWEDHAADLEMSQSEFVRTMVQAGRRDFEIDPAEGQTSDADPGGEDLETRVLDILETAGPSSWDDLVSALEQSFEDRLEDTLSALQDRNEIRHSGRHGGYTLVGADE
jgi:hypothetical protein